MSPSSTARPAPWSDAGKFVRGVLEQQDKSQAYLARTLGYSEPRVSILLSGRRQMSEEFISDLRRYSIINDEQMAMLRVLSGYQSERLHEAVLHINHALNQPKLSMQRVKDIAEGVTVLADCWVDLTDAKLQQYARQWNEAINTTQGALDRLSRLSARLSAYLLDTQAAVLLHQDDMDAVLRCHEQAAQYLEISDDPYLKAINQMHKGDYHREVGNWQQALNMYQSARTLFQVHNHEREAQRCARKLAIVHLYQGNTELAGSLLKLCQKYFEEKREDYELAKTLYTLAWVENIEGRWDSARTLIDDGLERASTFVTSAGESDRYLIMLGTIYSGTDHRQRGEYKEALALYDQALDMATDLSDWRAKGWIQLGRARVYARLARQQPENADVYIKAARPLYEEALQVLRPNHHKYRYTMTLVHFAHFLIYCKEYTHAERRLNEALFEARECKSRYYEAAALTFLCELALQRNQVNEFNRHADDLEKVLANNRYNNYLTRLRLMQAQACLRSHEPGVEEAAERFAQALDAALHYNQWTTSTTLQNIKIIASTLSTDRRLKPDQRQALASALENRCQARMQALSASDTEQRAAWREVLTQFVDILSPLRRTR